MYLPLSLVSRGVVSGLCLMFAKYWYNRREKKQELKVAQAAPSASSAAAIAETEALSEDRTDARAEVFEAGELHPAAAAAVSGEAANPVARDSQAPVAKSHRGTTCEKIDDDQRVEEALASGDLSSIDTLLEDICDPVLRNHLLNRLVTSHYRLRSDSKHRAAFYRVADLQIEEAPSILDGIEEIGRPRPDHIEAFKSMAIALDEDGRQDAAIAVCELALSLGLQDGTKTGFEGRITRLKKSRMRADIACSEQSIH